MCLEQAFCKPTMQFHGIPTIKSQHGQNDRLRLFRRQREFLGLFAVLGDEVVVA